MAFLAGWSKRQKLTIDHTQVDDELTDFPVKVIVSSDNPLFDTAKSDGSDVRFTSADGTTLLDFEREVHDDTNSIAVYHVKIPLVSSTSDTEIYLYYGNASATDASSPTSVWDSDYKLVLHMDGSLKDSTSNGNDGTNYGSTLGLASDGYYRSFDGVNDYIRYPLLGIFDGSSDFCVEFQYIHNEAAVDRHMFINAFGERSVQIQAGENRSLNVMHARVKMGGTWNDLVVDLAHNYDQVYYSSVVYDSVNGWKMFQNDVLTDTNATTGNIDIYGNSYNDIGAYYSSSTSQWLAFLDGVISEVRISSTARSDAWIKATSASLRDELLTFGDEESVLVPVQGVQQGVQIIFI
jgi:hypothetical protein